MKKSKKNYKKIVVIALAILLAAAGAIYGVNTKQLTGFTRINQTDFKPKFNAQKLDINQIQQNTYEASRDLLNKEIEDCNTGQWQKVGRFIGNKTQLNNSLEKIVSIFETISSKQCDVKISFTNITELKSELINAMPIKGIETQTFNCLSSKFTEQQKFFECRVLNKEGTENLAFFKPSSQEDRSNIVIMHANEPAEPQITIIREYLNAENEMDYRSNHDLSEELLVEIFTR